MKLPQIQVDKSHYFGEYDDLNRFISYYYQIDLVRQLKPKKILEIGIGNKTVSHYLKSLNFNITTCDFDSSLEPDYVSDIRNLPFDNKEFDAILACEILEHLPFGDFGVALKELARVTSKYLIISIPYASLNFEFFLRMPWIKYLFIGFKKLSYIYLLLRLPRFYRRHKFDGQHYWEMGKKGYSINSIRRQIEGHFSIHKELSPIFNPYHYFFILKKKI